MTHADLLAWPNVSIYSNNDRQVSEVNLISKTLSSKGTIANYGGKFEGYSVGSNATSSKCSIYCSIEYMSYSKAKAITSVFNIGIDGQIIMTDDGGIEIVKNGNISKLSGNYFTPTSDHSWWFGRDWWPNWYCPTYLGTNCYGEVKRAWFFEEDEFIRRNATVCGLPINWKEDIANYCKSKGTVAQSTGEVGVKGYREGSNPAFNTLTNAIKGSGSEIILADFGNNRIRALDITTNVSRLIAGNGQTYDNGDNGDAIYSSIYHPRSLAKDNLGNIYISTERGFIRKIDPNGFITTFAGKINGILSDKTNAKDMRLNNPHGMVVDTVNNYLYVADTGHHRIVKIDLQTKIATTVAGSGTCQTGNIGDDQPAIFASLCSPTSVGLDDQRNLLIFDQGHNRIRRVVFDSTSNGNLNFKPLAKDNSSLTRLADGSFVRTFRNGSIINYNSAGQQVFSQDRIGNRVTFQYNGNGSLSRIIDPTGRSTNYYYSGDKLERIIDPQGRETSFLYDGDLLAEAHFPDGSVRSFEYDEKGLMTSELDKRGNQTIYQYNQWNRLLKVIKANNSFTTFNDGVSSTIGNNYVSGQKGTLKSVSKEEVVDGIKDSKGHTTTLNKNEDGFVSKITAANGDVFTIERDLDGRPTKITRPDETYSIFTYDQTYHDLITKSDSQTGVTTNYQYDLFGNLLNQTMPNGETVSFDYDQATGLLLSKVMPLNTVESYQYYPNGLLKAKVNPLGQVNSYVYGNYGNLVTHTDNIGQKTQVVRDLAGNIISTTNANGQIIEYGYDTFNRLVEVKSAKGEVTSYNYLLSGELEKIIDPLGNETKFEYDVIGQLRKKIDPLGLITELNYDQNGNLVWEKDSKGQIKQFEYDNLDRIKKKILPDDLYEISYDIRGNVASVKNDSSIISYEYLHLDGGDVVSKEISRGLGDLADLPQSVLEFEYDESGNRVEMATTEGNFFYTYDKLNRLTKIINHKAEEFNFNYDAGSRITQVRSPAAATAYQFDNLNSLNKITHSKRSNGSTIAQLDYVRDGIGNITKTTSLKGDFNFGYDANNQLVNATHPEDFTSSYVYDALGNRTIDQNGNYVYDIKKQRLNEDWQYTYVYDLAGNLISKLSKSEAGKVVNYEYNSQNQLNAIKEYSGTELIKDSRYYYDALGRRVKKVHINTINESESFEKKFVYDNQEILFELDGNNSKLATYTHSMLRTDDVLAMERGTSSYFYLKDHLGTINEIVNESGNLIQRYIYSAFGKIIKVENANGDDVSSSTPVDNFYTFTGREFDKDSGLYYYRARYYDPSVGRFLEVDPYSGGIENPITVINKNAYAGNNPLINVDPNGQFFLELATVYLALFGEGEIQEYSRDAIIASVATMVIVYSGGTAAGALAAVGSTAGGSAVAAGGAAAIGGGNFHENFHSFFRISTAFLTLSAFAAPGGIAHAGGNGLQGQIVSNQSYVSGYHGGLTIGSSATYNSGSGFASHEFGHTLQFIGIASYKGNPASTWKIYLGIGVLGTIPPAQYNPIEIIATGVGGF